MRTPAFHAAATRLLPGVPYSGKLMMLTFLGIHAPLLTMLTFLEMQDGPGIAGHRDLLLVMVTATVFANAITMAAVWALLRPVVMAAEAVEPFRRERCGASPHDLDDAAARLMCGIEALIRQPREAVSHRP